MTPVHTTEHGAWAVTDAGSVGLVRRAALRLGAEVGLPDPRLADLAIVASELASNLFKHASAGMVHLRAVHANGDAGVELVAIDSGPGMADLPASTRDGHSTAGTLGIGLGAVARQASELDAFSQPGHGTVVVAAVWDRPDPPRRWAAGLARPMAGETVSGDGYAVRELGSRRQALVCDGLGHGPLAASARDALVTAFRDAPPGRPAEVLDHLHRSVSHTRGAVAAVIELGPDVVRCASVGNIAGWVVEAERRRGMAAQPGIVGDRQRRTIREYDYPVPAGAIVVLHTDGVTDRWSVGAHPGLLGHGPLVVVATLMRAAATRRDDAGMLVAVP